MLTVAQYAYLAAGAASPALTTAFFFRRQPTFQRPNGPVQIDWQHPLTLGLVKDVNFQQQPTWSDGASAKYAHGAFGAEWLFDGSYSATVPNDSAWSLLGDFTLTVFFRQSTTGDQSPGIIDKQRQDQSQPAWSMHINNDGAGVLRWGCDVGGGDLIYDITDFPNKVPYNTWARVTIRRAGTWFQWFLDGKAVVGAMNGVGAFSTNTGPVYVGTRNDGGRLNGSVALIRVHSRALSDADVAQHHTDPWSLYWTKTRTYFDLGQAPAASSPLFFRRPVRRLRLR